MEGGRSGGGNKRLVLKDFMRQTAGGWKRASPVLLTHSLHKHTHTRILTFTMWPSN